MKTETENKTIIRDESMHPFFLQVDDYSYNVCRDIKPKDDKEEYTKTYSFHANLALALQDVIQRKVKLKKGVVNLKTYISEIKAATDEITRAVYTVENIKLKK